MTHSRSRAYTLIELLTVLSIIAIILSMGLFALNRFSKANRFPAMAGGIRAMVRQARNTALQQGGFGAVLFVPQPAKKRVGIYAVGSQVVGYWHFEDSNFSVVQEGEGGAAEVEVTGGGQTDWVGKGTGLAPAPGRVGRGVEFTTGASKIEIPYNPLFSPKVGVSIDLSVHINKPVMAGKKSEERFYLVNKDQSYFIGLTSDLRLQVGLKGHTAPPPGAYEGAEVVFLGQTYPDILPTNEWVHISVFFYRGRLELKVNHIPRQVKPLSEDLKEMPQTLLPSKTPLVFGGVSDESIASKFNLYMDSLRIQSILESQEFEIKPPYVVHLEGAVPLIQPEEGEMGTKRDPDEEKKKKKGRYETLGEALVIYFDRQGGLDSRHHSGGVRIILGAVGAEGTLGPEDGEGGKMETVERGEGGKEPDDLAKKLAKYLRIEYIAIDPSGMLLTGERAKKMVPGGVTKVEGSDRKVR